MLAGTWGEGPPKGSQAQETTAKPEGGGDPHPVSTPSQDPLGTSPVQAPSEGVGGSSDTQP